MTYALRKIPTENLIWPVFIPRLSHYRIESIRAGGIPSFEIDGNTLDFIEYYLNYNEPSPTTVLGVLSYYQWLKNKLQKNPWNYIKSRGCLYLCELIRELRQISSPIEESAQPDIIKQTLRMIRSYVDSNVFASIPNRETRLTCYEIDQFDYIFRNRGKIAVQGILDIVYELDAFRSAHQIAKEKGFCYPELHSGDTELVIHNFFHPALPQAVRNDWHLEEKHIKVPIWLANRRLWKHYRRLFGWLTPDYRYRQLICVARYTRVFLLPSIYRIL